EQQLWIAGVAQGGVVTRDHRVDVGGLAGYRQLVGHTPDWLARLRRRERRSVGAHLLGGGLKADGVWNHAFDEDVVFQNQRFSMTGCSEGFEQLARLRTLVELVPCRRGAYEFHECESHDALRMPRGEVEGEGGAPVLRDEHDVVVDVQR